MAIDVVTRDSGYPLHQIQPGPGGMLDYHQGSAPGAFTSDSDQIVARSEGWLHAFSAHLDAERAATPQHKEEPEERDRRDPGRHRAKSVRVA